MRRPGGFQDPPGALQGTRGVGRAVPGVAGRGAGWARVLCPCPHCTLSSSRCTEKYFYICNVCCKTRKRLCLLKKKKSAKGKTQMLVLGFYCGGLGKDLGFFYVLFSGGGGGD